MESPFLRPFPPDVIPADLTLIETFGWRDGRFLRLEAHLARLAATAAQFGVPYDRAAIGRSLDAAVDAAGHGQPLRVRIALDLPGTVAVTTAPLAPCPAVWRVAVAADRLDPDDPWLRVKTSMRGRYDAARAALPSEIDEVLFLNRRGEVCEGTITNVFVATDGCLLTPPLASGLLPGVLRAALIAGGRAHEAVLTLEDMRGRMLVGNALRGLVDAVLVDAVHG